MALRSAQSGLRRAAQSGRAAWSETLLPPAASELLARQTATAAAALALPTGRALFHTSPSSAASNDYSHPGSPFFTRATPVNTVLRVVPQQVVGGRSMVLPCYEV